MSIVNAKLYEEEIRRKMWEIAYEPEYQYYFGDTSRNNFEIQEDSIGSVNRAFAVLDADEKLIGVISYNMDTTAKVAMWFGAINFSGTSASKLTFSKALYQVITDCFIKFGCEVIEWRVIRGNPVEKGYDRVCARVGGKIAGVLHRRAFDLQGNVHDVKIYEILREDFLNWYDNR